MRVTTIAMLTENRPGVLARVCHLFSRRGFNLLSVCAERTDRFEVYCITVVVRCDDEPTLEQIRKQLRKLIDVEEVTILSSAPCIERQVALVKVSTESGVRDRLVEEAKLFGASVADVGPKSITFELTSDEFRIESFLKMLESHPIIEVVRSGRVGLFKGDASCFNGRPGASQVSGAVLSPPGPPEGAMER
jgi:acetolactate synthase-1/3 small subunit